MDNYFHGNPVATFHTGQSNTIVFRQKLDEIIPVGFRLIQSLEGVWTVYTDCFETSIQVKCALLAYQNTEEFLKVDKMEILI